MAKLITQLPEGWRAGPNWEEINILLLNVAWVLIVWRTAATVKSRIHQWTKKKVERLSAERNTALNKISDLNKKKEDIEDHLKRIKRTVTTIITDNKLLKASCKAYEDTTLKSAKVNRRLKQKVKNLEKEAEIINNTLKMTAKLLQRREGSLQQKLAQEQILHQETETNLNSKLKAFQQDIIQMTMEREKTENSHKIQVNKSS
ncbi:uncharacterized protein LOC118210339 [Anguilla anguilla]|uniref:uncharacterized protein LOC118210339 n=1 Tax=Anguilla anguilla TaxID=7936 RepID=UPI0015ACB65B|nr:uncharacterized protein LOC118210339 [Anguilla anguilla]